MTLSVNQGAKKRYVRPTVTTHTSPGPAPLLLVTPPPGRCCDGQPVPPTGPMDCPLGQIPGINC